MAQLLAHPPQQAKLKSSGYIGDPTGEVLCKAKAFVDEVKSASTIYALIKNLQTWKELENIIEE